MTSTHDRGRPATNEAPSKSNLNDPSISLNGDQWQALAAHLDGAFAVVVQTSHGRYRRRAWLTLAPAERAAENAREAGHNAVVMLCELKPVYRVEGSAPIAGGGEK